jgi:hypothetical protein
MVRAKRKKVKSKSKTLVKKVYKRKSSASKKRSIKVSKAKNVYRGRVNKVRTKVKSKVIESKTANMGFDRRRVLLALLALAAVSALSITIAGVLTYYPVTAQFAPVSPPVIFKLGSNANQPDLQSPNTIGVSIGANKTSLSLTVHPTYQTVYYKNISVIYNNDAKAYNMAIKVDTPISGLPSGSAAKAYIYAGGATRTLSGFPTPTPSGYVAVVDLTTSGITSIGSLGSASRYEIDIYTYIPENTALPSSPTTANLYLVYSPETIT